MPATVPTRGVLKVSQNRVRTSVALQGSNMWENIIGIVNEERGTNAGVEALINAPQRGGGGPGRKAEKEARRAAAAEAVLATGGFDSAITSYNELLSLAKSQGAMGDGAPRGACKVCGQLGHLSKQCRNQFSKFYRNESGNPEAAAGGLPSGTAAGVPPAGPANSDSSLSSLGRSSDGSDSDSSSSDSESERRRRKRKEKERKRKRERERKEKKRRHKESRDRRERKGLESKDKKRRHRSRSRSPRRDRRH